MTFDESVRHQLMVEGYKEDEINEVLLVAPFLLKGFVDDLNGLNVPKVNEIRWNTFVKQVEKIRRNQVSIAKPFNADFLSRMQDFSAQEYEFQSLSVENNGGSKSDRMSAKSIYAEAEDTPTSIEGKGIADFAPFWILAHSNRIGNLMRRAWAEGIPNQDLIGLVRGTRPRGFKNGLLGSVLARDVGYVVRTIIQHVSTTARMTAMRLNPSVQQYRWVAILDSRTSPICRSLDGQTFDFGKGPKPPAHPNCRSTISPVIRGESEPPRQTYYQWLKKQPKKFQTEVLGTKRTALFRSGGISAEAFADLNLNRYFRPRTLKEMTQINPTIFDKTPEL